MSKNKPRIKEERKMKEENMQMPNEDQETTVAVAEDVNPAADEIANIVNEVIPPTDAPVIAKNDAADIEAAINLAQAEAGKVVAVATAAPTKEAPAKKAKQKWYEFAIPYTAPNGQTCVERRKISDTLYIELWRSGSEAAPKGYGVSTLSTENKYTSIIRVPNSLDMAMSAMEKYAPKVPEPETDASEPEMLV